MRRGTGLRTARSAERWRKVRSVAVVLAVGVAGASLALSVVGGTVHRLGPFEASLSVRPALHGQSVLAVPPLGDLKFRTHQGPLLLEVRLRSLRADAVQRIAAHPDSLDELGSDVRKDLAAALIRLAVRDLVVALAGAALFALVAFRTPRRAGQAAGGALTVIVAISLLATATFDKASLSEPQFTGVLAYAPAAIGDVRNVAQRLDDYSRQLGLLVTNVATLYTTASALPSYTASAGTVRLLHVSDLHLSPSAFTIIGAVAKQFDVDLVLDTGDLTDHGSTLESGYADGIGRLGVPYVYVRGNHDSLATEAAVRAQKDAVVLEDGIAVQVAGLTIMGQADPRFTPDKRTKDDTAPQSVLTAVGRHLLRVVDGSPGLPDVVAVHDPVSAGPMLGHVPLVLAGHTHARDVTTKDRTTLMVEGSTGGAGLRALEGDQPTPVEMTVLYLDRATGVLQAYDEITLAGLGLTDARIRRQVVADPSPG